MRWWSEATERLRGVLFRSRVDAEAAEEMRFHLDMEAERRVREEGLEQAEAKRQAAIAFGGVDRHTEGVRDARGYGWLSGLSLDVRLGGRMLLKHRGLTTAAVLALTIAIALAAAWFEFLNDMVYPKLPLRSWERVVQIQQWDQERAAAETRLLHDFERWRERLTTVTELSVASGADYQVTTDAGRFEAGVRGARLSAAGLRMLGVEPLLGRLLLEADELEGGALPVVLGYDLWQELFEGDQAVVGRSLRVGTTPGSVIGVMPEGFGFPVNHQLWVPFRNLDRAYQPKTGPAVVVIGRLAPGIELEEAQAELATISEQAAAEFPATHRHLRAQVRRYTDALSMNALATLMNIPFLLFLIVVCANVATLMFARTVNRAGELAVRSALGAVRRRLVLQLVAEALVLTGLAAALGLASAQAGLRYGMALFWEVQQSSPPFWFSDTLSAGTVAYVVVLAVLAAGIIGGIPAWKATGRHLRQQLVQAGSGGEGMRFGRVSTGVIVAQVALCVAFLPLAVLQGQELLPDRSGDRSFPAAEFVSGRVALEVDGALAGAGQDADSVTARRAAQLFPELKQRLRELPGVAAVTFVSRLPGFNHPVETAELEGEPTRTDELRVVAVDVDYFTVMGARVVAGRAFRAEDFDAETRLLVADAEWARSVYMGANPVGQRVRFPGRPDPENSGWYEIVGVVDGLDRAIGPGGSVGLFQPLRPNARASLQLYVRSTSSTPAELTPEVAAAISSVDERLATDDLRPLAEIWRPVQRADLFSLAVLNVVALVILLFALGGIYALMSFTVAQRAREIAIRTALGADPRRVIVSIFSRAARQIGLGVLIGGTLISVLVARTPASAGLVAVVAALMLLVGLAGCVPPAFRALRIQPTEALRAE